MGMSCSVNARPMSFLPGERICQPSVKVTAAGGCGPAALPAAEGAAAWPAFMTSSEDMFWKYLNSVSGTLGLPSGSRSKGLSAVYLISSSLVRLLICAWASGASQKPGRATAASKSIPLFMA
jgi:hypothetical protein